MIRKTPLRSISEKRRAQLKTQRSRSAGIVRRKKVKARNPKRHAKEWTRAYGSPERVEWVNSHCCIVASERQCVGPTQNVHSVGGGAGRKADASTIVPGCAGHHDELHRVGVETFQRAHGVDLAALARDTEAAWQSFTRSLVGAAHREMDNGS